MTPGTRLGPYEIIERVGSGGMGEVWKARDTRLNRIVAIKTLKEQHTARFEQEARAIAALNHPHICTLHDIGPDYLVMEYIDGQPLKGPLPVEEAVRLAMQIASALDAAHRKGVMHRDLKPGNIMVTVDGAVKLLDFGLAKRERPEQSVGAFATMTLAATEAGMVVGTVAYMSPEQAQGLPVDTRSDIFSFGLVLYEMLSGRRPFTGDTPFATMTAIVNQETPPLQAPEALEGIVRRCLEKLAGQRYQTMAEVKEALGTATQASIPTLQPSIAVLPFANMSADKENEYFSDGLAEEILNALTQLPGLRVIARTSAFRFRGEQDLRKVGQTLQVGTVLEGSVRRSGNRIRVSAQLINIADESQLWSERYDRELRDVFDIQDEIAQSIVAQLKVKLGTKAGKALVKRYTDNPEVHSLYLKGNFHLHRFGLDMEKGREYLEQAVALEPGYAPAWVQLANYHIARSVHAMAPAREELPQALEAARRAVAADETLAEAHGVLGMLEAQFEFRWPDALVRFETALRLNPASAWTRFWHGVVLCGLSRVEESLAEMRRAVDLDPLAPVFHAYLANLHNWAGQHDRAAEHGRQALEIDANYGMGMAALGEAYSCLGQFDEGISLLERARGLLHGEEYWPTAFLGCAYVRGGRRSEAEQLLEELEEKSRQQSVSAASLAVVALALGDADRALKWLDTAVRELDTNTLNLMPSPYFELVRTDPRYQEILRRMNLA